MRLLVTFGLACIMALFSLSIGGVLSAQEQDVPEEIVETPVTDNQDDSFGDGDYVNMDGCEGTVYLTPEAAMEAAIAAGMNLDDPGNIPFPYHEHISEDVTTNYMLNDR